MKRYSISCALSSGILIFIVMIRSANTAQPSDCVSTFTIGEIRMSAAKFDNMDIPVCLTGYVHTTTQSGKYLFSDKTDSIPVEIPVNLLPMPLLSDSTRLTIYGEVDKDLFEGVEIKVKEIWITERE